MVAVSCRPTTAPGLAAATAALVGAWVSGAPLRRRSGLVTRLRILLVEDDALIGALLAEMLGDLGYEVCGDRDDGEGCRRAAARHAPDMMVVDVVLAAGSGQSAMRTILRTTAMPHLFMTGGSREGFPAGATVLQKPFGELSLVRALRSVIATEAG